MLLPDPLPILGGWVLLGIDNVDIDVLRAIAIDKVDLIRSFRRLLFSKVKQHTGTFDEQLLCCRKARRAQTYFVRGSHRRQGRSGYVHLVFSSNFGCMRSPLQLLIRRQGYSTDQ